MSNINGFFVPGSISGSYVASKRNEEGSFKYYSQAISTGIQRQAALQDLEKSYEDVISKAYNSYLANQKAINASNMGQGYKEMYEQAAQDNLLAQQAEAANSVSSAKAQLLTQEAEAQNLIKQQYQTEVANLDRVANSMSNYLNFVKSLEGGLNYLSQLSGKTLTEDTLAEDIYDTLYEAQPYDLTSSEDDSIKGMAFSEWLHSQMKDTEADRVFEQWLYGGGWQDFKKSTGLYTEQTEEGKKYAEIEKARQEEYAKNLAEYEKQQEEARLAELSKTLGMSAEEYTKLSESSVASGATINNNKGKGQGRFTTLGDTVTDKYGNTWEYAAQGNLSQYGNKAFKDSGIKLYADAIGISTDRLKAMSNGDIFKVGEQYYMFQRYSNGNFNVRKITKK